MHRRPGAPCHVLGTHLWKLRTLLYVHLLHPAPLEKTAADMPEVTSLARPRICRIPPAFRLERTNFTVEADGDERPGVEELLSALQHALEATGIDVLEFRNADSVVSCGEPSTPKLETCFAESHNRRHGLVDCLIDLLIGCW